MFPTIPEGSTIIPQVKPLAEYQNGDIVCYTKNDDQRLFVRQVTFLDDSHEKMIMAAYNQVYAAEVLDIADVILVGKVVQMIVGFGVE